MEVTAEYRAIFAEEAHEHLQEWEEALLALESRPADRELLNQMFRSVHTLKGSAGFIGFDQLQRLAHDLESALQVARDGDSALEPETIDLLFRGLDLCRRMVEGFTAGKAPQAEAESLLEELRRQALKAGGPAPGSSGSSPAASTPTAAPASAPNPCAPAGAAEPPGQAPAGAGRRFRIGLQVQSAGREGFLRAFLVRNRLAGKATILNEDPAPEILRDSSGRFAYALTVVTDRDEACLRECLNVDLLEITSFAELRQEAPGPQAEARPAENRAEEVVRVSVERLDALLNLVGELVIQNSGFQSIAGELRGRYGRNPQVQELEEKTEGLAKITRDLQDGIMKVRMLPVNNVFSRFHRVVRDLAKDRGKEIALDIFGEETEIDKKVMDRIGDPLVHLVRNAVDHGIEGREQRLAAGKPAAGLVRLGAFQDGDHICIEVSDDGRGLDREAVLAKGLEKGLVRPEEADRLPDEQVLALIFLPGFSTAKEVTEVSGRGVGMDVVKRAVEALGGTVRVRSQRGRGTSVTISLPLTMAIIPAVLVEAGGSTLAVPLSSVKEVLKVAPSELKSVGGYRVLRLREQVLSLVELRQALGLGGSRLEAEARLPVVIVDFEDRKIGLGVDRVLGNREIVIKSLSRHYREIEGLIGASILGDGRIALIVDVEALIRKHHHLEGGTQSAGVAISLGGAPARPNEAAPAAPPAPADQPCAAAAPPAPAAQSTALPIPDLQAQAEALRRGAMEQALNAGAIQASLAVSQLSGREVRVSFPESRVAELAEVPASLGGLEASVCGIFIGITGQLAGGVLMVLPERNLLLFHELLHRLPPGSCAGPQEVDQSAIGELGNVLAGSFISAIADETRLALKSQTPELKLDMCQAVIDSVLARFNRPGDRLLLTETVLFLDESRQVACHLLLFLEPESLTRLLDLLAREGG
jgi:two-component system chemotaxis sensor kinase CheA